MMLKKSFELFIILLLQFNDINAADLVYQPSTLLNSAYCTLFDQITSQKMTLDEARALLPADLHKPLEILDLTNYNKDAALLVSKLYYPDLASIFTDCGASATTIKEIMDEFATKNQKINNKRKSLQSVFSDTLDALLKYDSVNRNTPTYLDLFNKIQIIIDTGFVTLSDKQIQSINNFNDIQLTEILLNYLEIVKKI